MKILYLILIQILIQILRNTNTCKNTNANTKNTRIQRGHSTVCKFYLCQLAACDDEPGPSRFCQEWIAVVNRDIWKRQKLAFMEEVYTAVANLLFSFWTLMSSSEFFLETSQIFGVSNVQSMKIFSKIINSLFCNVQFDIPVVIEG